MFENLVALINQAIPGANATVVKFGDVGDSAILVSKECILPVCKLLKGHPDYCFNVLQAVTACDFLGKDDQPGHIEVSYVLASFIKNLEVMIKLRLARGDANQLPEVDSVVSVWSAADFLERECYDMLGIKFVGHPDFRRILCPQDWEGYPLRRDYVAQTVYREMAVYPAHKLNVLDQGFGITTKADNKSEDAPMKEGRYH